ncbi:hypothetical protein NP493_1702g00025 [Ridgeia piscesae]|uniref:Uncharacterized protein n=1 Tax=Ridgeia piscesae TaxID=27915 RepID=A0AAD9JUP9_RIDPI|nr:hypothetical protein NP493_1702g00025 [Ridgeia piscesae]
MNLKINKVSLNVAKSKHIKFPHLNFTQYDFFEHEKKKHVMQRHLHNVFCFFWKNFFSDDDNFVN